MARLSGSKSKNLRIAERRSRALQLRMAGASLEAIASVISVEFQNPKYNRSRAFEDIENCLRELSEKYSHETEEYRKLELERLDHLYTQAQDGVKNKDVKSIAVSLQIIDRRCKILCLEAPVQMMIQQATEKQVGRELRTFIEMMRGLVSESAYGEILDAVKAIGGQ